MPAQEEDDVLATFNREDYLTPNEASPLTGLSGTTIRRMINAGEVPALRRHGGGYLIHKDDVRKLRPTKHDPS